MDYMILDDAGNALASFADEVTAHACLYTMVRVDPDAADHVRLIAYADDGMPMGEARSVWDVPLPVTVDESFFLQPHATRVFISFRSHTQYFGGTPTWGARIQDSPATTRR